MKILALLLSTSLAYSQSPATWTPLFNGENLDGWHTQPGGKWEVIDGIIRGTCTKSEKRHGLLVSDKRYANFILRAKFKVTSGDSGLYFRAEKTKTNVAIKGFQAEVDQSPQVGGLYETAGRAWVISPDPKLIEKIVKHGEWTQILITASGKDITVSLNGVTVSKLPNDEKGRTEGHIALQLHGGMDMHVEFKDIDIFQLPN